MTSASKRIAAQGTLLLFLAVAPLCRAASGACAPGSRYADRWQRASFEGVALEYRTSGAGAAVVFVHAGVFGEWFEPLLREPALQRGYCTLALLEPPVPGIAAAFSSPAAARSGVAEAIERYRMGDKPGAVDTFLRTVAGADYRVTLDERLPGAFANAVAAADTFFAQELPAVRAWTFDAATAARIRQPVLAVMGERSPGVAPIWQQRQDWLMASLPHAEAFVLGDATHLLHLENPRDMAERLAAFFAAHPQ